MNATVVNLIIQIVAGGSAAIRQAMSGQTGRS